LPIVIFQQPAPKVRKSRGCKRFDRKIALEAYGSVTQVVAIKDANPLIEDINQIFVGQVIYLPPA
jgi:hypothetical protein